MGYVSTGMGDCFGTLLVSLMALHLVLVDGNPFRPCYEFVLLFGGVVGREIIDWFCCVSNLQPSDYTQD